MPARGFTIIEALVVVVIITLLLTLLLPALGQARWRAKVAVCESNLRQYSLGLINYATTMGNGRYPVQDGGSYGGMLQVWSAGSTYYPIYYPDKDAYMTMFTDVICGGSRRVLWCPLDRWLNPSVPGSRTATEQMGTIDPQYPDLWHDSGFYLTSYMRYANTLGIPDSDAWTHSGNAKDNVAPTRAGDARDAIITDYCASDPGWYQEMHMEYYQVAPQQGLEMRRGDNVAYGDGHVEVHTGTPYLVPDYTGDVVTWDGANWIYRASERWQY